MDECEGKKLPECERAHLEHQAAGDDTGTVPMALLDAPSNQSVLVGHLLRGRCRAQLCRELERRCGDGLRGAQTRYWGQGSGVGVSKGCRASQETWT